MKKKMVSMFCALALCLSLLGITVGVGAPNNPCFMAVNDSLMLLEDRFIPIAVNGQYYVPYTALDDTMTGVSLGIFPYYNAAQSTLTISDRTQTLTFNLTAGTCTDRNGTALSARAVIRNGLIYLPVRFVCEYFDLNYSSRVTTYGPMVRVRSAASTLDDNTFVTSAQQRMEDRLREWRKKQNEAPPVPTTPIPGPSQSQEPDKSNVGIYLAFRADVPEALDAQLEQLENHRIHALFFFPAEGLAQYDAAIRKVVCAGHGVGFLVTGDEPEGIQAQVEEGNRLLTQIIHMNTYTVLASEAEKEKLAAIEEVGLVCWQTDLDAQPDGRTPSRQASTILANAARYEKSVYILSDTSAAGVSLMGRILPEVVQDHYALRLAVETEI